MNKKFLIIITAFSFCLNNGIFSQITGESDKQQSRDNYIKVIGKSFGDSIILRWAPENIDLWLYGNKYGYYIYKYKIVENDTHVINKPVRELLNDQPLQPMSLTEIEKRYGNDSYAAIVAQAIYGSSFTISSKDKRMNFINMASELSNRYSFALFSCDISLNAAKSHGLIFIDRHVKYGDKYVYCIKINSHDSTIRPDSSLIFISVADTFKTPRPFGIYAASEGQYVTVSWEANSLKESFTAFHIERADAKDQSYVQINKQPVINVTGFKEKMPERIMYIDTIPYTDHEYCYRIRGITPFGEISMPSDTFCIKGEPLIVGINPIVLMPEDLHNGTLRINWEFPKEYESRIKGFVIERADKADGIYKSLSDTILSNVRMFIDLHPRNVNYYQICAISFSGRAFCSFPSLAQMPDSLSPLIPSGLSGNIDSSGIVILKWNRNTDIDFMSYKIYRANNPTQGFAQINKQIITDEYYIDTIPLNNLTRHVYYAISAQDYNYNESAFSEPLKIVKPDTIPPVAPMIKDYKVTNNKIIIKWLASSSIDVINHSVYKRKENEQEWLKIFTTDKTGQENILTDTAIIPGLQYEYLIIATDENGNESTNRMPVRIKAYNDFGINDNVSLNLKAGEKGNCIIITWSLKNNDIKELNIYKATDTSPFVLLRKVNINEKQLIDNGVKPYEKYYYKVQGITHNNNKTKLSEAFIITL